MSDGRSPTGGHAASGQQPPHPNPTPAATAADGQISYLALSNTSPFGLVLLCMLLLT